MNAPADKDMTKPFLVLAEPQLFVSDVLAACDFYTRKLGFEVRFVHGEPPFYGQVVRDGARLNLRHVDDPVIDNELRKREDLLSATIILKNIQPLFLEYQKNEVAFHQTPRSEPWGARTFIIADPDGNLICFSAEA